MAEKKKTALGERTHPKYTDNINEWNLYRDSVDGGDDFINDNYLFSHRLEDAEDFNERLDRAYYLNYCEAIPNIYNHYIMKEDIERPPSTELEEFRKNVDGNGTSIEDFIVQVGFWSKVYGVCHILVDSPKSSPKTKSEEKETGFRPYCRIIHPTQLVDWSLDSKGRYNWVIVESEYYDDADPTVERDIQTHYKLITKEEWRVEDEEGNSVTYDDGSQSSGINELGEVPIITLYHDSFSDDKIGRSLLKDIVYVNRAILNWCSCIDEQIERQTFSQLVIPDDGTLVEEQEKSGNPLHRIGTTSIWTFPADAGHPPNYISPNTENITAIWNLVIDHVKEIFRLAKLIGTSDDMYLSRSGRAAQMGFLGVNSALSATSKRYEKCENDISKLALKILGKEDLSGYEGVKYPTSFDIATLSEEVDSYFRIMEKNFSVQLNRTLAKDIARRATPLAPNSVRSNIEDEIDNVWDGTVVQSTPNEQNAVGEEGNPNSNIGKTFRTKGQKEEEKRNHSKERE